MLLEDIITDKDFNGRVEGLARDFRKKAGIAFPVHQLGIVVPDVAAAAAELESRGFGPFMMASATLPRWNERGADASFRGTLGMAYHRGVELELLEPGTGSDFYRRSLDPRGRPVVQHIGFLTPRVDRWAGVVNGLGCPTFVRGRIGVGPLGVDFAYMDTEKEAGLVLEFIAFRFLGIPIRPASGIIAAVGRIQKKTGKRRIDLR